MSESSGLMFEIVHDKGPGACGGVAWRCSVNPEWKPHTFPRMDQISLLDGSHPQAWDPIQCGSCGGYIYGIPMAAFSVRGYDD